MEAKSEISSAHKTIELCFCSDVYLLCSQPQKPWPRNWRMHIIATLQITKANIQHQLVPNIAPWANQSYSHTSTMEEAWQLGNGAFPSSNKNSSVIIAAWRGLILLAVGGWASMLLSFPFCTPLKRKRERLSAMVWQMTSVFKTNLHLLSK